jgi:hypothetical protein
MSARGSTGMQEFADSSFLRMLFQTSKAVSLSLASIGQAFFTSPGSTSVSRAIDSPLSASRAK